MRRMMGRPEDRLYRLAFQVTVSIQIALIGVSAIVFILKHFGE